MSVYGRCAGVGMSSSGCSDDVLVRESGGTHVLRWERASVRGLWLVIDVLKRGEGNPSVTYITICSLKRMIVNQFTLLTLPFCPHLSQIPHFST